MKSKQLTTASDALSGGRLLKVEELATVLGFHPESVRRAIRQRRIQAIRLGRFWRVPPGEVAYLMTNGLHDGHMPNNDPDGGQEDCEQ
jgi:excisionase family DNA binding protein